MRLSSRLLGVAFWLGLCGFARSALGASPPVGPLARAELGNVAVSILAGATRVQAYRLNPVIAGRPVRKESPPKPMFDGYEVTNANMELGAEAAARLAAVLFDDRTYESEEDKCALMPGVAFRAWRGRESVDVLVCFHCGDLAFLVNDATGKTLKRGRTNFALVQPALISLARRAFPDDSELRALKPLVSQFEFPVLLVVALKHHTEVVPALIAAGADVNARDSTGRPILSAACLFGLRDLAAVLLSHGADVNAKDPKGEAALDIAQEHHDEAMIALLKSYGAKSRD